MVFLLTSHVSYTKPFVAVIKMPEILSNQAAAIPLALVRPTKGMVFNGWKSERKRHELYTARTTEGHENIAVHNSLFWDTRSDQG